MDVAHDTCVALRVHGDAQGTRRPDSRPLTFINGDLTVSLAREPVGQWVLLDAETWAGPDAIGIAAARLADRDGYFGRAVQSVLFEKR